MQSVAEHRQYGACDGQHCAVRSMVRRREGGERERESSNDDLPSWRLAVGAATGFCREPCACALRLVPHQPVKATEPTVSNFL